MGNQKNVFSKGDFPQLLEKVRQKDQIALARAITIIENEPEKALLIEEFYAREINDATSYIIGFTGSPGAGKSTLVDSYVSLLRKTGAQVGIIAVDPSSPFTGGALLGDRIRMKRHFTDDGVFIRSMGSRGCVGGLNDAVFGVIMLYKLYGFDYIIVETVGAGQSEIDIVYVADTVVLVLSPGGGDEIQLMKAGIMEIADIFVINKSDMDGADLLKVNLEAMLKFSEQEKPIVLTVATSGKGVGELAEKIESHKFFLKDSGEIDVRRLRRLRKHAETIIARRVRALLDGEKDLNGKVSDFVERIVSKLCTS
ncbi:methylmalonyl Co-A mutase-associated GTPase MeaB [Fervidobacterium thailandense]|uniref:Transporter n=1 Tax=Fervidobacterium thailandense TaxID=1008305 RepID=A0A1E3G1G6_9BACT|nr:methylmalonyl Co-A mutase-associated GTPase MeaB [Fervidobacterium thailandense]ODN30109.1 transporter [Fervidobacterium thailandense]